MTENRGGGTNDGVALMPARGHDVPMRTIGVSLFVCVSNGFAGMMGLHRYGVMAAKAGTDPGEVAARVVSALLSGRIAVTNSASGHARLMETIPLFSASHVPRTELN